MFDVKSLTWPSICHKTISFRGRDGTAIKAAAVSGKGGAPPQSGVREGGDPLPTPFLTSNPLLTLYQGIQVRLNDGSAYRVS